MVLGERLIDDGAEWRTFNHDDALYGSRADPNRAGMDATLLSSLISFSVSHFYFVDFYLGLT